ncbi:hypothetical protein C1H46_007498 [Malus baccata]|uniref:Uncharacterized protein n=1 Tax=Malus baccata TaxID=106549 RepID=A0A540N8N2_MALBA|nr:hypothetical protein C1H46_007498 [Malus baccata]
MQRYQASNANTKNCPTAIIKISKSLLQAQELLPLPLVIASSSLPGSSEIPLLFQKTQLQPPFTEISLTHKIEHVIGKNLLKRIYKFQIPANKNHKILVKQHQILRKTQIPAKQQNTLTPLPYSNSIPHPKRTMPFHLWRMQN